MSDIAALFMGYSCTAVAIGLLYTTSPNQRLLAAPSPLRLSAPIALILWSLGLVFLYAPLGGVIAVLCSIATAIIVATLLPLFMALCRTYAGGRI
ncbi:hypothetical protein [Acetobacter cibinongensis]|uniref:Uncharacterized protein n=1 Tax=Acetobacter cibinongensis TaxID=146475 RepID=A0A1Z5YZ17_9PROT|nr:hypothetical protein [Acetobacter cibinongensis]OUJ04516.1 hypothetical protein HK14_04335 [Acetobacter cibinongensis]GAN59048.1 hypothetical protein Abci_001_064 [Acetobacter cibinongensis]GBQ19738.1 hypothetical protein AA0482_2654 [Acetobacter cibinongensis NRIC 0482]GEL58912.1 hypothetical protein ACI01nite_15140 [Acetobacter cibinongensis]